MKNNIRTRLAALFCAAALLLGVWSPAFAVETTPTVAVSSTSVQPGGSCTLTVSGQNFSSIGALAFLVTYDTNAFELTSATGRAVMGYETVNTKNAGFVQFSGVSTEGISGTNDLLRLTLRAKDDADPRAYSISLMVTEAAGTDLETVAVTAAPGTITVEKPAEETTPTVTFYSRLSGSTVKAGDSVSLTLYSYSLYNLAAAQIDFTYDEDVLAFENLELLPAMQREGAISSVKADTKGHVLLAYASPEAVSTGDLMKITFTVRTNAPAGVTKIGVTPLSLANDEQKALSYNTFSASVTVEQEEEEPVLPRIWLDVPETLRTDASFTVDLYAEGSSGLAAGDFTVAYDPDVLVCENVTSSQSSGEDESLNNATVVIDDRFQSGKVKFSVMCHGGITEDTKLISMQFRAKNNAEMTTQLTPAVFNPINDALKPLTFDTESASLTVVVPKLLVVFKNWDGTVLKTDDVPYLSAAIAPATPTRAHDEQYHYEFSAWDTDFSAVEKDLVVTAQYAASAHELSEWSRQDDALHRRGCTSCAYTETAAHTFGDYVSDENATCTADGTKTASCTDCEATDTQPDEDSALGHTFTKYASNGDATCTADGTETAVCDRENCNETQTRTAVGSMLPHKFTGWSYFSMDTHQGVCTCGETSQEPHTWENGACTGCHAAQVELEHTTDADKEIYALRVNYGLVEEKRMTVDLSAVEPDVTTGSYVFEMTLRDAVAQVVEGKSLQIDLGFLSVSLDAETAVRLVGSVLVIETERDENGSCAVAVKMRAANGSETSLSGNAALSLHVPQGCAAYLAWYRTTADSFRLLESLYEEEQGILRVTDDPQAEQIFVNCISVAETDGTVTVDATGPASGDVQIFLSSYQDGKLLQCDFESLGSTFGTARRGDQMKLFVLDDSFVPLLPFRTI